MPNEAMLDGYVGLGNVSSRFNAHVFGGCDYFDNVISTGIWGLGENISKNLQIPSSRPNNQWGLGEM
jgi:hypothetical protein